MSAFFTKLLHLVKDMFAIKLYYMDNICDISLQLLIASHRFNKCRM